MATIVFTIVIPGIELFIFFWLRYLSNLEQDTQRLQMELAYKENCDEQIEKTMNSIRKYRHDLSKHIQVMEYLAKQEASLPAIIFAMKEQECNEKKIPCHFHVDPHLELPCSSQKTSSLLVNLLDNAIEENVKIPMEESRNLTCILKKQEKCYELFLENHLYDPEHFSFETAKEDKISHGYGTKIIQEIVKEVNGNIFYDLDKKQSILVQRIRIPIKEEIIC